MNKVILAEPSSAARSILASDGPARTSGAQGIFAQLLASTGAAQPASQPVTRPANAPETVEVDLPEDPAARARILQELGDTLDELQQWATDMAAMLAAMGQAAPAGTVTAGTPGLTDPDLAVNAGVLPADTSVLAAVQSAGATEAPASGVAFATLLADRLGLVLQRFDRANGTNTVEALAANVATLPALTLRGESDATAAAGLIGVARGLLGLGGETTSPAVVPSSPVMLRVPGAQSIGDLIRQAAAGPGSVAASDIPEGRAVEAFRDVLPAASQASAEAAPRNGLLTNLAPQLRNLQVSGDTARVQLVPSGLGVVEITVTRIAGEATGLAVSADNPRILSALQNNADQFAAILRDSGLSASPEAMTFAAMSPSSRAVRTALGQAAPAVAALDASEGPTQRAEVNLPPARFDALSLRPIEIPAAQSLHSPQAQLASHVTSQLRGNQLSEGTTRIQLNPQGLGSMEIDLVHDDNGALRITVRAENPAVLGALRENREILLAALRDNGTAMQDGSLGFEDFGRGARQQPEAQAFDYTPSAPEEDEVAAYAPRQNVFANGRVDIIT